MEKKKKKNNYPRIQKRVANVSFQAVQCSAVQCERKPPRGLGYPALDAKRNEIDLEIK